MSDYCESCGVLWSEHLGVQPLCAVAKRNHDRAELAEAELSYWRKTFGGIAAQRTVARNLHDTTSAQDWTNAWMDTIAAHPTLHRDEGAMIGWFANAIETGRTFGKRAAEARAKRLEEALRGLWEVYEHDRQSRWCGECGASMEDGEPHAETCSSQATLATARKAMEGE